MVFRELVVSAPVIIKAMVHSVIRNDHNIISRHVFFCDVHDFPSLSDFIVLNLLTVCHLDDLQPGQHLGFSVRGVQIHPQRLQV